MSGNTIFGKSPLVLLTSTRIAKGTNGEHAKAHAAVMRAKKQAAKHSSDDSGYTDSTEADLDAPPKITTSTSEPSANAPKGRKAPKDMKKSAVAIPSVIRTRSHGVSDTIAKKPTGTSASKVTHKQQAANILGGEVKTHLPSRKAAAAVQVLFDQINLDSDEDGGDDSEHEDRDMEGEDEESDNNVEESNSDALDEDHNDSELGIKFIPLHDHGKVMASHITTKPSKKVKVLDVKDQSDSEDNGKPAA